ncbi:MAG: glucose-1-phosphate cytidylyltransferase [Candidatus Lindowbacteria bacterium]|nr:glucose-1-phosphate cytidylyltransferase [Candidatus Lindowbacteria bacterium]
MKTVILCGGKGTRLSEETQLKPKPMVEIGAHPIMWHIMKIYAAAGHKDFVLALGYKGEIIKDFFLNYHPRNSDVTVKLATGKAGYKNGPTETEDWTVQLIDTGYDTMTGGRLLRLKDELKETFMLTYGDGLSDTDIGKLIEFHRSHGKIATVTIVRPPARFGSIILDGTKVTEFQEKPQTGEGWINGGFFVFEPKIFDYIADDTTELERKPLESLAADGELMAFEHPGFWKPMDTLRDKTNLQEMWETNQAPWKVWD